jgi:hypothetical protein
MKIITKVLLISVMSLPFVSHTALAQPEQTKPGPVEAFFCMFQPGKGMDDLMPIAQRFAKWADQNDPSYSARILTPAFGQFTELPQVVWLGANTSGIEMGKGQDTWRKSGGDLQKAFDSVVACGAHMVVSSVPIHVPDGNPGDGVVMFTQCNIADGSDGMKAIAAHTQNAKAMRTMGAKNSSWLFFPMIGAPTDREFDYWGVATFPSWSDYFAGYEMYINGGGREKNMELMKGVSSCGEGSATVWDVKLVRQGATP